MRVYRLLLLAFPPDFRARFGDDIAETFADRLRAAKRRGRLATMAAWLAGARDLVVQGLAERRRTRHANHGGHRVMSNLKTDVAYAFRLFRRRPAFTTTAVLTLALGIGANVAIFSVVRAVLINDLPYPNSGELVHVSLRAAMTPSGGMVPSVAVFEFLRDNSPMLHTMAVSIRSESVFNGGDGAEQVRGAQISAGMSQALGLAPIAGRTFGISDYLEGSGTALISESFWRAHFNGRADAVGGTIRLDGSTRTIVGVMPDTFDLPGEDRAEIWQPLIWRNGKGSIGSDNVARLPNGVDLETATREIDGLIATLPKVSSSDPIGVALKPLIERHREYNRPGLLMLQAAAGLLLAIACANLANLLLTNATSRRREVGMRTALGAGRGRLIRQLLTEAALLAVIGGGLGVALAYWLVPTIVATASWVVPRSWDVAVRMPELGVGLALAILTTLIAAVVPALTAARADVLVSLRETTQITSGRMPRLIRNGLVSVEVALAVAILASAGLLINSFARVMSLPMGFDARGLSVADVRAPAEYRARERGTEFVDLLRAELVSRLGEREITFGHGMPYSSAILGPATPIGPDGRYERTPVSVPYRAVTPEFFSTLRIPILRGRPFDRTDVASGEPVIIVNEQFVRQFGPAGMEVGALLKFGPREATIVGIVGDTRNNNLADEPRAAIYFPLSQRWPGSATVAVRGVSALAMARALRETLARMDPDLAASRAETVASKVAYAEAQRRFLLLLFSLFASLGAALAAVGVYGVTAHVVGLRTRELGVRLALGSSPHQLKGLVVRQGLTPILTGLSGGVIGAWWMTEWLKSNATFSRQLYAITAHDPLTLAAAGVGLLLIGALACWIPARRAGRVDPVGVLRSE